MKTFEKSVALAIAFTLTIIKTFEKSVAPATPILADNEDAHITLSKASIALNEAPPVYKSSTYRTVADMEGGKFRKLFDRHKTAYRY